ncbi:MAG: TIGR03620 family F420-dependent LLM class oxidoreductase [Acidimicrobiia bacterium]|nr:TIGR03620 family F420-dependent LLM class oxidoreductase [Acidimicrobiia bacterium]
MTWSERLAAPGVWQFTDAMSSAEAREAAARIESLGYSAQWFGEAMARHAFVNAANLLRGTERLIVATGIAGIQLRTPFAMKAGAHDLAEVSGGRFVLGMGVSHAPLVEGAHGQRYDKPLATMRDYLTAMDEANVITPPGTESPPVVLAALGPKMLALAGASAQGAHPYWTTPEHTARAREIMGRDALLCVEQKCVLTSDREVAHARALDQLGMYRALPNYRNNWLRLGFTEAEIDDGAPRFLDAVVAWGTEEEIGGRIQQHYDAGATHVCIQAVPSDGTQGRPDWDLLEALAPSR